MWLRMGSNEEAKFIGATSTEVRWLYEEIQIHFVKNS